MHHKRDSSNKVKMVGKHMSNLENVTKATDGIARKIWLASLGAYAKGFEEIQNKFEKINGESVRLFNELVSSGEKLSASPKATLNEEAREETAVDKRVAEVRIKLGLDTPNTDARTAELSKKVDELTEQLSKLS